MKSSLTFTAFQGEIALTLAFALSGNVKSEDRLKSRLAGSICNELFSWVSLQQTIKSSGLKLSEPIGLKFEVNGMKFDTGTIKKELQDRLILRNNPAGRKSYAIRFNAIFAYVTKKVSSLTFEQLIANLDNENINPLKKAA